MFANLYLLLDRSVQHTIARPAGVLAGDRPARGPALGDALDRAVREVRAASELPERVIRLQTRGPGAVGAGDVVPVRGEVVVERLAAAERSVAPIAKPRFEGLWEEPHKISMGSHWYTSRASLLRLAVHIHVPWPCRSFARGS